MAHLDWKDTDVKIESAEDRTIALVGDWELSVWRDFGDGEPRVRDTDAAKRLELGRPRDVRKLIERTWSEEKSRPYRRATVARQSTGNGATREYKVNEYWLTEAQLLKLCARSETKVADAILDDMIQVYIAVRKGLMPRPEPQVMVNTYEWRRGEFNAEADATTDALQRAFPGVDRKRARAAVVQYALGQVDSGGSGRELGYWDETTFLDLRAKLVGMRSLIHALVALGVKPRLLTARKGKGGLGAGQLVLDLGCHKITVTVEQASANDDSSPAKSA